MNCYLITQTQIEIAQQAMCMKKNRHLRWDINKMKRDRER